MKKKITSYLVFTSGLYRLLLFVLVPIVITIAQILLHFDDYFLMTYLVAILFPGAEVFLDYWVFGGIAVKGGTHLEYLKSSKRGVEIMGNALRVNMARQFLATVLLFVISGVVLLCQGGMIELGARQIMTYIDILLLTYFMIVTEITIVRHLDGVLIGLSVSCFAFLPMIGLLFLIAWQSYVMLPVMVILSAISSVLGVRLILKRVKESYYDKTA